MPTVVDWSKADNKLIVSGDDRGGIISWRIPGGETQLVVHDTNHITTLSCSPHDSNLVLVGYVLLPSL